jgi:hypothetical protein
LERQFPGRELDLQQLVAMAQQDTHVVRIASDFTWLDTDASWPRANLGFSHERWYRYQELFIHAGLPIGIYKGEQGEIFFPIYVSGFVAASSDKGYVYSEKPLSPIVESLDRFPKDIKPVFRDDYIAFKPFKRNWYIYRDED